MSDTSPLNPLKAALSGLLDWLRAENLPFVVIGGVASSLIGRPRTTRDVVVVVWIDDLSVLDDLLRTAGDHGLEPRLKDAVEFARESRVLLLTHSESRIDVDVALGALPFEKEAIEHAEEVMIDDRPVPVPRPEDLIIMKAVAHRPRDAADIEAVLDARPELDRDYVRRVVGEFSAALESPEILEDLERILRYDSSRRPSSE